jgi:hypothetical protein
VCRYTIQIKDRLQAQKVDILSRFGYHKLRFGLYIDFLSPKMTSKEKSLNYKFVDLVENYSFRINFISI